MIRFFSLLISILIIVLVGASTVLGQGCSDAGICSIENIRPTTTTRESKNQFNVGIGYGNADQGIAIFSQSLAYSHRFGDFSIESRLTAISQNGAEANMFGISDLYLIGNYRITDNFRASAGFKLPLSDGNKKLNDLPLPMDYQASLGTVDLLVGANYTINRLMLALAYQQPLTHNKNSFLEEDYPSDSEFRKFQSTNNYVRKGDALLRISRSIPFGDKVTITPSILTIYHLGNDKFTDLFSVEQEITGSEGLTLNVNLYADFAVGENSNIELNLGSPLIVREARPDGLTRSFVLNLEYQIIF